MNGQEQNYAKPIQQGVPMDSQQQYGYQQQYQPNMIQVQQQMQQPVVFQQNAPMNAHGALFPTMVNCQTCHKLGMTRMEKNTLNAFSLLWCFIGGCWCSLIPGCCETQTEYKHYCLNCGAMVGTKEAECC